MSIVLTEVQFNVTPKHYLWYIFKAFMCVQKNEEILLAVLHGLSVLMIEVYVHSILGSPHQKRNLERHEANQG